MVPVSPDETDVTTDSATQPVASTTRQSTAPTPGVFRQFVEGLVCLAMAVVLFRTFHLEGYMISTGSMAPSLYGYHKRVVCPSCQFVFAHGVAFDASVSAGSAKGDDFLGDEERVTCSCPNCGQYGIDVTGVPRNQGDQLLVHKHAYAFQEPRRWEVVVFRNPNDSGEAYVKRIVGLPGERLQVRHGDLYVNDRIERKDLYVQRAIRVPVYDHDFAPTDEGWRDRWIVHPNGHWRAFDDDVAGRRGFHFEHDEAADATTDDPSNDWLRYRHWIRAGGGHETSVHVDGWPLDAEVPDESFLAVRFDSNKNTLSCIGAMSDAWRDRLLAASDEESFRDAVVRLYEASHVAPISDSYGYNRSLSGVHPRPVRDLTFVATLEVPARRGRVVVRMTDGDREFDWLLDFEAGKTSLTVVGDDEPARTAPLPDSAIGQPIEIEMSTIDRRVSMAIDRVEVLDAIELGTTDVDRVAIREPVAVRVDGGSATLSHLALYRDVYYTRGRAVHGVDEPHELGDDEYFALGDNSPVSFDSRSWPSPAIPKRLFLGKPLVVHLPSKPGRIRLGEREAHIRIPDFSRIRYVR